MKDSKDLRPIDFREQCKKLPFSCFHPPNLPPPFTPRSPLMTLPFSPISTLCLNCFIHLPAPSSWSSPRSPPPLFYHSPLIPSSPPAAFQWPPNIPPPLSISRFSIGSHLLLLRSISLASFLLPLNAFPSLRSTSLFPPRIPLSLYLRYGGHKDGCSQKEWKSQVNLFYVPPGESGARLDSRALC